MGIQQIQSTWRFPRQVSPGQVFQVYIPWGKPKEAHHDVFVRPSQKKDSDISFVSLRYFREDDKEYGSTIFTFRVAEKPHIESAQLSVTQATSLQYKKTEKINLPSIKIPIVAENEWNISGMPKAA